jgi:wee1-like protein kinase
MSDPDHPEESNRFTKEFQGARVVGSGNFAVVYRARNSIDQQEYAIKKTKKPLARGSLRRREMLQEALALASVAIHSPSPYIVRYFSSWIEDDHLFIQTELCDGSLKDSMISLRQARPHDPRFLVEELAAVIRDICMGLSVLHAKNLVHLDVKPENVLVKQIRNVLPTPSRQGAVSKIHKIADLGLATAAIGSGCDEISEGDSRYLAREVLRGDFTHLTKADVFSLGILCYELGTNPRALPCDADEWHRLREGTIEEHLVSQLPSSMIALMRRMMGPIPADRPPCTEVLRDQAVCSVVEVSIEVLQQQLRVQSEAAELEMKKRATAEEKADRYWSELLHMKRQELLKDPRDNSDGHSRSPRRHSSKPSKLARSVTA